MSEPIQHPMPALVNGASEFEIDVGKTGEPWHASNGSVGITVYDSDLNIEPSGRLTNGVAMLIRKANHMHGIGSAKAWREQVCIAELNGVFIHVLQQNGMVNIVVADRRID